MAGFGVTHTRTTATRRPDIVLSLLSLWLGLTVTHTENIAKEFGPDEVCWHETFEAQCDPGEVLLIREAHYGRMSVGRCLDSSALTVGYLECGINVRGRLDAHCSGQRQCEFPVSLLSGENGCSSQLVAYLQVSYACVRVVGCDESLCDPEANVQGSFPRGLLSSYVALQSDCGSSSCPWRLQALPGQKFNFTLLDFSHSVQQDQRPGSNFCHRYAIIEESNDGSKDITSCTQDRHKARERHVYESSSNSVTVTLYTPSVGEDSIHFLLRYDVVSCPDVLPPEDGIVKRQGDRLDVTCRNSNRAWHLMCSGTSWVGEIGKCQDDTTELYSGHTNHTRRSPFGMLIVIGLGVALGVMIGILLLVFVGVSMKRRRRRQFLAKQRVLLTDAGPTGIDYQAKDMELCPTDPSKVPLDGSCRYPPPLGYTATIQTKHPVGLPLEEQQQQTQYHTCPLLPGECAVLTQAGTCEMCLSGVKDAHVYETTKRGLPAAVQWGRSRSSGDDLLETASPDRQQSQQQT